MIHPAALGALLVIYLLPINTAHAQGLSGSIADLAVNPDLPIHIESDSLEIDEPKSTARFIGGVRVSQDKMVLTTDELLINYSSTGPDTSTQLRTIDAIDNVAVNVNDQTAKGDKAHYDLASETVTLTGNVILSQGGNIISGERIIIDLATGTANMISKSRAPGERVRGVFIPNRTNP